MHNEDFSFNEFEQKTISKACPNHILEFIYEEANDFIDFSFNKILVYDSHKNYCELLVSCRYEHPKAFKNNIQAIIDLVNKSVVQGPNGDYTDLIYEKGM